MGAPVTHCWRKLLLRRVIPGWIRRVVKAVFLRPGVLKIGRVTRSFLWSPLRSIWVSDVAPMMKTIRGRLDIGGLGNDLPCSLWFSWKHLAITVLCEDTRYSLLGVYTHPCRHPMTIDINYPITMSTTLERLGRTD